MDLAKGTMEGVGGGCKLSLEIEGDRDNAN
jgi:hypothetical protein